MIMLDGIVGILLIGFLLFCLLDVITSDPAGIRNLPKVAWIFLVFINPIGGIAWLIAGRPQDGAGLPYKGNNGSIAQRPPSQGPSPRPRRPGGPRRGVAPDDDPAFLAELNRNASEHEQMLGSWESDLRRREEELRRKGEGEGDTIG